MKGQTATGGGTQNSTQLLRHDRARLNTKKYYEHKLLGAKKKEETKLIVSINWCFLYWPPTGCGVGFIQAFTFPDPEAKHFFLIDTIDSGTPYR